MFCFYFDIFRIRSNLQNNVPVQFLRHSQLYRILNRPKRYNLDQIVDRSLITRNFSQIKLEYLKFQDRITLLGWVPGTTAPSLIK